MVLHTYGDSHCAFVFNKFPNVRVHHLGAILSYSFGLDPHGRCKLADDIRPEDYVLFSMGEIDCRCHVHKHITEQCTYQQIIEDLVMKYMDAIQAVTSVKQHQRICVYNVLPPPRREDSPENVEYPFLGTNEERRSYVQLFNSLCKEQCKQRGYIFVDVYDQYADSEGFLAKETSDGCVHILVPHHLEQACRSLGIL